MKSELPLGHLPLFLHSSSGSDELCRNSSSLKEKRGPLRKNYKFSANFDSFQGVLKRISDMKLNGSLDSEEPSTESERSECSSYRIKLMRRQRCCHSSLCEEISASGSVCEDESSVSSFAGSDQCPPYEEIPIVARNRYIYHGLSSQQQHSTEKNYMNLPSPKSYIVRDSEFREGLRGFQHMDDYQMRERRTSSLSRYGDADPVLENCGRSNVTRISLYSNSSEQLCQGDGRPTALSEDNDSNENGITDLEKHQIETFFRGLRTDLFVCSSLANLYVSWKDTEGKWVYKHTGVPVIILDRGDTKSRSKKRIQILLAEKGTCFPLWRDTIDNLTSYQKAGEAFHTMHLSSDHRQIIGLSFDSSEESDHFYNHVSELTSNPENINISVPGSRKNKKHSIKKQLCLPHKDQISNPCLFEHVTSVTATDKPMYMSLQTLLDKEFIKERENIS